MMDQDTLTALLGSIAKWEAIVAGTGEDHGTRNCPLCQMFYENGCAGCPVAEKTGGVRCARSPYEMFCDARCRDDNERAAIEAQDELDFLKSLLPS